MDFLPFVFEDAASRQLYLSWTSSRSNSLGNILLRNLASEQSVYSLLTTERTRDYDAKIAPTKTPGRYLMVWVSDRTGEIEIYSRIFKLYERPRCFAELIKPNYFPRPKNWRNTCKTPDALQDSVALSV